MLRRTFLKLSAGLVALGCQRPASKSPQIVRFAIASDGHYGQPNTDYQGFFEAIIKNLQQEKATNGLDFVVFNGDLFHDDPLFLPEVKKQFERLGFPYFVTRGNHDRVSATQWRATWGYDLNHAVELGDCVILLADTSNEKGEYLCPDTTWIEQKLKDFATKKHLFLMMHIPAKTWSEHGTVCPELNRLLSEYSHLKATFHGHDHALDSGKQAAKPAFFDGHFGGNWGVPYKGYRIVETRPNGQCYTYQWNFEAQTKLNEQVF
ncbi:MAG: metallophosphoesterase family protein [Runella sp.]